MKTTKQLLTILKLNHLRTILKRQRPTQITKRYYVTLDADQPDMHEL